MIINFSNDELRYGDNMQTTFTLQLQIRNLVLSSSNIDLLLDKQYSKQES